jgi:hypothetical protein
MEAKALGVIGVAWLAQMAQRLAAALRLRLHKHGLRRTLGFYLALWWWRPQCER